MIISVKPCMAFRACHGFFHDLRSLIMDQVLSHQTEDLRLRQNNSTNYDDDDDDGDDDDNINSNYYYYYINDH